MAEWELAVQAEHVTTSAAVSAAKADKAARGAEASPGLALSSSRWKGNIEPVSFCLGGEVESVSNQF